MLTLQKDVAESLEKAKIAAESQKPHSEAEVLFHVGAAICEQLVLLERAARK